MINYTRYMKILDRAFMAIATNNIELSHFKIALTYVHWIKNTL